MPLVPWLLILSIFWGIFYLLFRDFAFGVVPGLIFGYVTYVHIHYTMHRPKCPLWLRNNLIHHHLHHHRHPDKAFGVTTPIWDRLFNTMPPEKLGWNKKGR